MWVNDHAISHYLHRGNKIWTCWGNIVEEQWLSFHQCLSGSSSQFTEALMWDFFFLVSLVSTSQLMGTASSINCWCFPLNLLSWSELLSLDPQWLTCLSYNEEQRTLWLNLLPNNVSESLATTARPHLHATSFPISRRRSSCLSSPPESVKHFSMYSKSDATTILLAVTTCGPTRFALAHAHNVFPSTSHAQVGGQQIIMGLSIKM